VTNNAKSHHAPLVHTKGATLAVIGKTLHLRQAIDTILYANFVWEALSTLPPAPMTPKKGSELTKAIWRTLAGHTLQRLSTPPKGRVLILVFSNLNEGSHGFFPRNW
jgi:hypothetical protein